MSCFTCVESVKVKCEEIRGSPVVVHIYDVAHPVARMNALGRVVGTGAFHAGVQVYNKEWSYCSGSAGIHRTGVFVSVPGGCPGHAFRESISMGETRMSKKEVDKLIFKLMMDWPGSDYDLLQHNCCHFTDHFCRQLGVGPVPPWITSLADAGAKLRSGVKGAVGGAVAAVADCWQAPEEVDEEVEHGQQMVRAIHFDGAVALRCRARDEGAMELALCLDSRSTRPAAARTREAKMVCGNMTCRV